MPMPLVRRIEILEGDVNALRQLPDQVSAVAANLAALREDIRTGDEETRRQMRILHEEVLSRIALLDEGRKARRRGKR
jgi:hypothetical protein